MTAPPDLSKLYARAGEPVTASKWNALLMFIERMLAALGSMVGPGLDVVDQSGDGFFLQATSETSAFGGAFFASLGNGSATFSAGTVNVLPARIGELTLDGQEVGGRFSPAPQLRLGEVRPSDDLRTWLCIQVKVTPDQPSGQAVALIDPEDTQSIQMVHRSDVVERCSNGYCIPDEEGCSIWPVAVLIWSNATDVSRVEQIVYFNQSLRVETGKEGGEDRHYYSAAS